MVGFFQSFRHSFSSRLSQRIIVWVFLSILVIELVIFIPSYYGQRHQLRLQLEQGSHRVLVAVKGNMMMGMETTKLLDDLQSVLTSDEANTESNLDLNVIGAVLYTLDGSDVDHFGERPILQPEPGNRRKILRLSSEAGDRYDVAWPPDEMRSDYTLVVRYDTTSIKQALRWYIARIAILVLIISVFVTLVTFWGLERILITPILHLRDDLDQAGELVNKTTIPRLYSFTMNRNDELGAVTFAFRRMFQQIHSEIQHRKQIEARLQQERDKSDRLLRNMLPETIAQQLKNENRAIANRIDEATILFADIADFTGLAAQVTPIQLVNMLNQIFSTFDRLAEKHQLEKIKTIGDAYMVVGGATTPLPDSAKAVVEMALDMQSAISKFKRKNGDMFELRIGINTGPVVAGVIGLKRYSYDLWGDAVNIASRMESHGAVGKIHLSESTYQRVKKYYIVEPRGDIQIKGRGVLKTYFLLGRYPNQPYFLE